MTYTTITDDTIDSKGLLEQTGIAPEHIARLERNIRATIAHVAAEAPAEFGDPQIEAIGDTVVASLFRAIYEHGVDTDTDRTTEEEFAAVIGDFAVPDGPLATSVVNQFVVATAGRPETGYQLGRLAGALLRGAYNNVEWDPDE